MRQEPEPDMETKEPPAHSPSRPSPRHSLDTPESKPTLGGYPMQSPLAIQGRSGSSQCGISASTSLVPRTFSSKGNSAETTACTSLEFSSPSTHAIEKKGIQLAAPIPAPALGGRLKKAISVDGFLPSPLQVHDRGPGTSVKTGGKKPARLPTPHLWPDLNEEVQDALTPDDVQADMAAALANRATYRESPSMGGELGVGEANNTTAGRESTFIENLSQPPTTGGVHRSATVPGWLSHREAANTRVVKRATSSSGHSIVGPPGATKTRNVRRSPKRGNLRLDTAVAWNQGETSSSANEVNEERSPYIETYDERLGRRITVHDRRASTVAEHVQEHGAEHVEQALEHVETVREVSDPIPAAMIASRCSWRPKRDAPLPPTRLGDKKSKNLFKSFYDWTQSLDERWDARMAQKRVVKEEARKQKVQEKAMVKERKLRKKREAAEKMKSKLGARADASAHLRKQKMERALRERDEETAMKFQREQLVADAKDMEKGIFRPRAAGQELTASGSLLANGSTKTAQILYPATAKLLPPEETVRRENARLNRRIAAFEGERREYESSRWVVRSFG